jgi:hypothetical protein
MIKTGPINPSEMLKNSKKVANKSCVHKEIKGRLKWRMQFAVQNILSSSVLSLTVNIKL